MIGDLMAGGVVVTGLDLLSASLTLAYVGRLVFQGMFSFSCEGGYEVVKRSLEGQHIMPRAR